MAVEWVKVVADVGTGGAVGALDQILQNQDDKREDDRHKTGLLAAGKTMPFASRFGTYFNYGVPILAILGTAMGWLKGDWATRITTAGSQLAGREATHAATIKARPIPAAAWQVWERVKDSPKLVPGNTASTGSVLEI